MKWYLTLLFGLLWLTPVYAHRSSDSFIHIQQQSTSLQGHIEINLSDLSVIHDFDANADDALTWAEIQQQEPWLRAWINAGLQLSADNVLCSIHWQNAQVSLHQDEYFLYYAFNAQCSSDAISLDYQLLFNVNSEHKALINWQIDNEHYSFVVDSQRRVLKMQSLSRWQQFISFIQEGIGHILAGFDHLLFLLCLLLPAAQQRQQGRWQARADTRRIILDVVKIISAFTVAHSITLALASLNIVQLPTRLSESIIALSIIVAALNVIWPFLHKRLLLFTFAFGLVHGFGFATVLAELGLPTEQKLMSLFAFNVGVEVGQLTVVLFTLPLLLMLRHHRWYSKHALPTGAGAAALLATIWLVQRAIG